ncbi:MAG: magnesium/cobalt transporter CorA [Candidatus Woesearchaeota archaeon]
MIDIYYFDKKIKKGKLSDLRKLKNKKKWLDITSLSKEEKKLIQEEFGLHPLTSEDLFDSGIRIKVEEFPEYLFSVFYGVRKNKTIELNEMDFLLGNNVLITNHKGQIESFQTLKNNEKRLLILFKKGLDFLFHRLLDLEIDNFFPVLENIDDEIEDLEDEVTKKPRPELMSKILKLKRRVISIKKITLPQREKISFLAKNEYRFISKKSIPYFRDVYDHAIRVSDTVDNYREAISGIYNAYMSAISNNMNDVMKTLSIMATIALPLGIISGIFGTNFDNLPGQHMHYGFWIMILLMLAFVGGMMLFFNSKGWIYWKKR